jgi:DNA-binding MarR family transcriptional regulator
MRDDDDMSDAWLTVSALARLRGVDKAAVSRRVARLEAAGALTTRAGERGTKLINVAEFTHAVEMTKDAVREANGRAASPIHRTAAETNGRRSAAASQVAEADMGNTPSDPILAREQARKTKIAADLGQIELDRRLGLLVPLDDVVSAARTAAERLRRGVEQMGSRAEDVAAGQTSPFAAAVIAAMRLDPAGARVFFKTLGRAQLSALAATATMFDPDDERAVLVGGSITIPDAMAASA